MNTRSRRIEPFTELKWDYGPDYGANGLRQPRWLTETTAAATTTTTTTMTTN